MLKCYNTIDWFALKAQLGPDHGLLSPFGNLPVVTAQNNH